VQNRKGSTNTTFYNILGTETEHKRTVKFTDISSSTKSGILAADKTEIL
jgi:hypothetical protein